MRTSSRGGCGCEISGRGASDGVVAAQSEDLVAVGGHQDGVLPLRRQLAILGDRGPAIAKQAGFRATLVDHRLDGEGHAFLELHAGAGTAVMQNLRLLMEDLADAVATVFADHGEPILLGMFLDDFTDVPESCTWPNQQIGTASCRERVGKYV